MCETYGNLSIWIFDIVRIPSLGLKGRLGRIHTRDDEFSGAMEVKNCFLMSWITVEAPVHLIDELTEPKLKKR